MHWEKLYTEYLSKHKYFTARKDKCVMPNGRVVPEYFVVELPLSVCALAITDDNKVVLVKQFRYPLKEVLWELPGGFVDEGEQPHTAIERELMEETGYTFNSIEYVGKIAANPGVLQSYTYLYLATGGKKVTTQQLDPHEQIEIHLLPLEEVRAMFNRNEFTQALHTCCLLYAFKRLAEKNI